MTRVFLVGFACASLALYSVASKSVGLLTDVHHFPPEQLGRLAGGFGVAAVHLHRFHVVALVLCQRAGRLEDRVVDLAVMASETV